jgi:hypothetical protein
MSRKTVNRAGMLGFQPLSPLGDRPVIGIIDIPAYQAPTGARQASRLRKFSPEPIRQGSHAARPGPLCGAPFARRAGPSIGTPACTTAACLAPAVVTCCSKPSTLIRCAGLRISPSADERWVFREERAGNPTEPTTKGLGARQNRRHSMHV